YDIAHDVMLPVSGITAANTPLSPPSTGEWTPPVIKRVGSRILVTHPGFPGGDIKFGWFDVSGFDVRVVADFKSGQAFLFGGFSLLGMQPGMTVSGSADIPAGATIKNLYPDTQSVFDFSATSDGSDLIVLTSLADDVEMVPGKTITGPGIQDPTIIIAGAANVWQLSRATLTSETAIFRVAGNFPHTGPWAITGDFTLNDPVIINVSNSVDLHTGQLLSGANILSSPPTYVKTVAGSTVTMTQAAIGTATGAIFFGSGVVVEMNVDATADGTGTVEIEGGTPEAPQWGAGDCAINPLPSTPLGVAQMNGRAWFADGVDGIPWSDSLLPCVRT